MTPKQIEKKCQKIRLDVLNSVEMAQKGHLGGTFSCIELLGALYYGEYINPKLKNRNKLILSKGHACLALYSIFLDLGVISQKVFDSYGQDGGLGGQLDTSIPGVDFHTGSLGHSLGVGAGMAIANPSRKIYTIIGDSELYEGSVWEAITFASEQSLSNLICIVDRNRLMVTDEIGDEGLFLNFSKKIAAFSWDYYHINGHDLSDILQTLRKVRESSKPVMILADTIKGKGVSFMENGLKWHHSVPSPEEFAKARQELTK